MHTILRNLFYTLHRFRLASVLNLIGLSVAFTAFTVILMKVNHERNFDTCYPDYEQVAFVAINDSTNDGELNPMPVGMVNELLRKLPCVEAGSIYTPAWTTSMICADPDHPRYFKESPVGVYADYPRVVGMDFVEGSGAGFAQTDETVLISESAARRYFGDSPALGRYLYLDGLLWMNPKIRKMKVCGVYKDFPQNSQLYGNHVYYPQGETQKDSYDAGNVFMMVRLKAGNTADDLNRQMAQTGIIRLLPWGKHYGFKGYPIHDLYFDSTGMGGKFFQTGNRQSVYLILCIGFLIVMIACINLVNFSTALTPMRLRSINTQKVLGSSNSILRFGLVAETVGIALLAWIFSLFILHILMASHSLDFLGFQPEWGSAVPAITGTGVLALVSGILSGLYPAFYMTSIPPVMALKGNVALYGKGLYLRKLLICIQFVISATLMIAAVSIYLQNRLMREYKLGFAEDELLLCETSENVSLQQRNLFQSQLESHPEISGVGYSNALLGGVNVYTTGHLDYQDRSTRSLFVGITPNLPEAMGFKLVDGRFPVAQDSVFVEETEKLYMLCTAKIKDKLLLPAGEQFDYWGSPTEVVGYVEEMQMTSLNTPSVSFVFMLNHPFFKKMPFAYIRVKAGSDPDKAFQLVRQAAEQNFVGYPCEVRWFNDVYQALYIQETHQQVLVTLSCILAVIISLVGIFGLVIFEAQHRRKEIALRKIYGATTGHILWRFNRSYLCLVTLCMLVSTPLAWFFISRWLEHFSVRITLSPWIFFGVYLLLLLFTAVTITLQSWRTANENPIRNIKTE